MSLSHLAHLAEGHSGFIAGPLATYQQTHNLDDQGLAEQLQCSVEDLTHLKLCRLPRLDHQNQDIERIATHIHADPTALARVLNSETVEP